MEKKRIAVVAAMPSSAKVMFQIFRLVESFPGFAEAQGQTAKEIQRPKTKKQQEGPNDFYPTHGNSWIVISAGGVIDEMTK